MGNRFPPDKIEMPQAWGTSILWPGVRICKQFQRHFRTSIYDNLGYCEAMKRAGGNWIWRMTRLEKGKFILNVLYSSLFFYDVSSDIMYATTTPFYSKWLIGACWFFIVMPHIVNLYKAYHDEHVENASTRLALWTLKAMNHEWTAKLTENESKTEYDIAKNKTVFVVYEEIPQVFITLSNNYLSGKTLSWVAITSPLSSYLSATLALGALI